MSDCTNSLPAGRRPYARKLLAASLAAALAFAAGSSAACASVGTLDVVTRDNGQVLPVYPKDGRRWIVGAPGREYSVRVCNRTGARVLAVMSVDGVNIVSGDTASPAQSGYVLSAWECADITGWRKSMERTAAFYFTELPDAYATRTGRPENVGVIGVAFFREKAPGNFVEGQGEPDAERRGSRGQRRIVRSEAGSRAGRHPQRSASQRALPRRPRNAVAAGRPAAREARHRPRPQRGVAHANGRIRAGKRDTERDDRDPLRPSREPRRDGRAAAPLRRAHAESVSGVAATSCRIRRAERPSPLVADSAGRSHTRGRCPRPHVPPTPATPPATKT